ncbi:MAG: hypothetical protein DRJ42_00120 [Deltaproteobacteria bacterium]|nr:MAG: hypothetical protein DRJ42_00120 [Deltaproteobacteria bacterium]
MPNHRLFFTLRLIAGAVALVLPLLGCIGDWGNPVEGPPPAPVSCEGASAWVPERIELLDMGDMVALDEDPEVSIVRGGQGSSMVGFYVVVYGDDIPDCLDTTVTFDGQSQSAEWTFDDDGPRRAMTPNPVYWIWNESGAQAASVTIGETTVEYDVDVF